MTWPWPSCQTDSKTAIIGILDRRAPETLRGAAVKIRHMLEFDADRRSLRQVLAVIEREDRQA